MLIVVVWWLWMQVMGLAALPLAYRFFRRLPDRGYAFARPLGLLLTSYVLWLGASLGLLRNSVGGALFSILVVAIVSFLVYRRGRVATGGPDPHGERVPEACAPEGRCGAAQDPGLLAGCGLIGG